MTAREVLLRVVVRDKQGQAVGGLTPQDFDVLDRGVAQRLTSFTIETPETRHVQAFPATLAPKDEPGSVAENAIPERFVAYLFDDVHLEINALAQARLAATKHLAVSLRPTDRAAILTTSGQVTQDYTADRKELEDALARIVPHPIRTTLVNQCPWMDYYLADLIINRNDPNALRATIADLRECDAQRIRRRPIAIEEQMVQMAARQALQAGNAETRLATGVLRDVVQRASAAPGERTLVLVSPGFIVTTEAESEVNAIIEQALRAGVLVNTVDARGLWSDPTYDAARSAPPNRWGRNYLSDAATVQGDVLMELAEGTGGMFFHNNNDLGESFRRTATVPDYVYVLAFSPRNLKSDGKFHELKVKVRRPGAYMVTARKGYMAPSRVPDPAETAKQEIQEAVFSREEMQAIPLEVGTEFFKTSEEKASLAVRSHVGIGNLTFRGDADRNINEVTVVCAIFDRNGRFVRGEQNLVQFRMRDETRQKMARSAIIVRSNFDLQPGGYLVRVVVRDSEGQQLSAANAAVEIP